MINILLIPALLVYLCIGVRRANRFSIMDLNRCAYIAYILWWPFFGGPATFRHPLENEETYIKFLNGEVNIHGKPIRQTEQHH